MRKKEESFQIIATVEPEGFTVLPDDALLVESPNLRGTRTKVIRDRGDLLISTPGLPTVRINLYSLAGSATAFAETRQQGNGRR
jgi:hypothetical protein